jgi:hypothetical protein
LFEFRISDFQRHLLQLVLDGVFSFQVGEVGLQPVLHLMKIGQGGELVFKVDELVLNAVELGLRA